MMTGRVLEQTRQIDKFRQENSGSSEQTDPQTRAKMVTENEDIKNIWVI